LTIHRRRVDFGRSTELGHSTDPRCGERRKGSPLAAARRPFLYFPLRNHFEQNRHVRHRLERYGAGRCMDYDDSPPEVIAEAIATELDRRIDFLPVESDGAARAAALIAPLI
jgi:hypothetical protein